MVLMREGIRVVLQSGLKEAQDASYELCKLRKCVQRHLISALYIIRVNTLYVYDLIVT